MKTLNCFCFFLLAFNVSTATYQYFKFVEHWPPSYCMISSCSHIPPRNNFTIYGLWPRNFSHHHWDKYCSNTTLYRHNIRSLESQLDVAWPSLRRGNFDNWEKQWDRYGTCSENIFKKVDYFELAIDIKNRLDIFKVLVSADITPSESARYDYHSVTKAIRRHIGGVNPEMHCVKHGGTMILLQIRLCLDANGMAYISCPHSDEHNRVSVCQSDDFYLALPP